MGLQLEQGQGLPAQLLKVPRPQRQGQAGLCLAENGLAGGGHAKHPQVGGQARHIPWHSQEGAHSQPPHPGVGVPLGLHQGVELLQASRLAGRLVQPVLQALADVRQLGEALHGEGAQPAQHGHLQPPQRGRAPPLGPQLLPQGQGGLGQAAGQIRPLAEKGPGVAGGEQGPLVVRLVVAGALAGERLRLQPAPLGQDGL